MFKTTWFICLVLFVCTLGILSFDVNTPDGRVTFKGWLGKINDAMDDIK